MPDRTRGAIYVGYPIKAQKSDCVAWRRDYESVESAVQVTNITNNVPEKNVEDDRAERMLLAWRALCP